jgi:hypothetical protein
VAVSTLRAWIRPALAGAAPLTSVLVLTMTP